MSTKKSKVKFVRIVLASSIGSIIWAGCAQPRIAVNDPAMISQAPVDMTQDRPDTHPELRSGLWQITPKNPVANVIVAPNITTPDVPPGTVDTTSMLAYDPEVINSVPPEAQDTIIIEAAGAERPTRRSWRDWFRRKKPEPSPESNEIRHYERETIIEQETNETPKPYKPSSENLDENGVEQLKSLFVRR